MTSLIFLLATQYLNVPYKWSANGPFEFDCSGLVMKVLNDYRGYTGDKRKLKDMSSQDIFFWALKESGQCCPPEDGSLLFYGKDTDRITHIAIAGPRQLLIEAGGAGRETKSMIGEHLLKHCSKKDARVRYRKIGHRKDLVASIKLF